MNAKQMIENRDIYTIKRWINEKKIDPDNAIVVFKCISHNGFKSTYYLLKTFPKIQKHSINYFKRKVHEKRFQWNRWIFFRKHYSMTIFLYFGIISAYSNDIEMKIRKTFNNFEMEISLVEHVII